ncbi:MAG: single-stranded DNA-binding protein [Sphaerochaeta sp.]|nr:single-stranded DNA-binding protein [Sphaerochaeta sp.]
MNNLNSVLLEGNLVKDPELAVVGEQQSELAKFTIAVNRYYKGADGKPNQEVLYIGVDAWGTLGKNCLSYLTKGRGVRVVGRLRQDRWNDKDGAYRERIFVVAEHVEFRRERSAKSADNPLGEDWDGEDEEDALVL